MKEIPETGPYIVLAEKSELDAYLVSVAIAETRFSKLRIVEVADGAECIDFFMDLEARKDQPPGVLLLHPHLPKVTGHGVLEYIVSRPFLSTMEVLLLTSKDAGAIDIPKERIAGVVEKMNDFHKFKENLNHCLEEVLVLQR